jgi:hypothetical protein
MVRVGTYRWLISASSPPVRTSPRASPRSRDSVMHAVIEFLRPDWTVADLLRLEGELRGALLRARADAHGPMSRPATGDWH